MKLVIEISDQSEADMSRILREVANRIDDERRLPETNWELFNKGEHAGYAYTLATG